MPFRPSMIRCYSDNILQQNNFSVTQNRFICDFHAPPALSLVDYGELAKHYYLR